MELLLNLVWLLTALLSLAGLILWARHERDRRRILIVGVATVCALMLLFPIISLTDDLQATAVAVEETISVRRIMSASALQIAPDLFATQIFVLHEDGHRQVVASSEKVALPTLCATAGIPLRGPPSISF